MKQTGNNKRGVTLVEVLTAMAVGAIISALVYSFIMISSKSMRTIAAIQLMQQESSLISEIFMRTVRNGSFVTVGTDTVPPKTDTAGVTEISIFSPRGKQSSISIDKETIYFVEDWSANTQAKILSNHLWQGAGPNSFTVYPNGDHVSFTLNLFRTVGDDSLFLSHTVGDIRCKN